MALGRDRLLKVGIGDLEAVLGGQLDADAHELPVAMHRNRSPLLRAELQGGQDALAVPTGMDVDRLPVVREGGAPRSREMVMDLPAVEDGGEGANVPRRGLLEGRALDRGGPPIAVPPSVRLIAVAAGKPVLVRRKPPLLAAERRPLQLLALSNRRLLLGLARGEHAACRVQEVALAPP